MNIGLRYDRTWIPPYGANGSEGENGGIQAGAIDFNRGVYVVQVKTPSCNERGKAPCIPGDGTLPAHVEYSPNGKIYKDSTDNWQPRFGLAYRLSEKTALRGSFGMFFDNWAGVTQSAQNYEGTWPDVAQQLGNNLNNQLSTQGPLPNRKGTNPFPEGLLPTPTPFDQVQWYMGRRTQSIRVRRAGRQGTVCPSGSSCDRWRRCFAAAGRRTLGPGYRVRHQFTRKKTWLSGARGCDRTCWRSASALCQHCRGSPLSSHV